MPHLLSEKLDEAGSVQEDAQAEVSHIPQWENRNLRHVNSQKISHAGHTPHNTLVYSEKGAGPISLQDNEEKCQGMFQLVCG